MATAFFLRSHNALQLIPDCACQLMFRAPVAYSLGASPEPRIGENPVHRPQKLCWSEAIGTQAEARAYSLYCLHVEELIKVAHDANDWHASGEGLVTR